ncbi:uncharacterized protein LOC119734034 [Patiria miniata]|uniref:CCHC-type domain-containing protein n=1 Tax=Patiria miniata TaxID=46514 RepID=A0A914AI02_PATMI|nr:uncharacterized protein LOC119734034 [Patiria miniata]
MSNPGDEASGTSTELLFEKFQLYFDQKFDKLSSTKPVTDPSIKELRNKLEAQELARPGNTAQYLFCGELQIILDKIKCAILQSCNTDAAISAIQQAEDLLADRKRKIKIADSSKAGWMTIQHLEKGAKKNQSPEELRKVQLAEEAACKELEGRKKLKRSSTDRQYASDFRSTTDRPLFRGMPNDMCFTCKMVGHWSRDCPFNVGLAPSSRVKPRAQAAMPVGYHTFHSRNALIPWQAPQLPLAITAFPSSAIGQASTSAAIPSGASVGNPTA